jgi:hypothetical protein
MADIPIPKNVNQMLEEHHEKSVHDILRAMRIDNLTLLQQNANLREELEGMREAIYQINEKVNEISEGTDSMVKHIGFIEGVYATIKRPLNLLMRYVSAIPGIARIEQEGEEDPAEEGRMLRV